MTTKYIIKMKRLCLLFIVLYLEFIILKGISISSSPLCFPAPEKNPLKYSCICHALYQFVYDFVNVS